MARYGICRISELILMAENEESNAEVSVEADDSCALIQIEDPKIGSIAGKLKDLFPDLQLIEHNVTVNTETIEEEDRGGICEVPVEPTLPCPVTEEARVHMAAMRKLDDLVADQAREEIEAMERKMRGRMMEQQEEDEAKEREMKEDYGLSWGRQIPKEGLNKCFGSPSNELERCSCAQPKDLLSCGDLGANSGGQQLMDSTRQNAAANEKYLTPCSIVMDSEVRLKYISTGLLPRFPNLVATSVPDDPNYLQLTFCLRRRRRNKYEWPQPVLP